MFSTFSAVFEALNEIEKELSADETSEAKLEQAISILLSLRNTMDKCVQSWLKFEERLNGLQQKYGFELPDTLPEGFLDDFTNWEDTIAQDYGEELNDPSALINGGKYNSEDDYDYDEKKGYNNIGDSIDNAFSDDIFNNDNNNDDDDDISKFSDEELLKLVEGIDGYKDKNKTGLKGPGKSTPEQVLKENFIKISEEKAITSFRKAMGFWDLAMMDETIRELEEVVKVEPNFITGHLCLGLACSQKREYEKAVKELKLVTALTTDPQVKTLANIALGNVYAAEEKYRQAHDCYQKAIDNEPALPEGYFNSGAVLYNLQEYEKAVEAFNICLNLDHTDWEAALYAGKALGYLRRWDDALLYLEQALAENPREPLITFEIGVIYKVTGKTNKAAYYFHTTRRLASEK